MAKCFDCNHDFKPGSAFCSNCGRSLKPKTKNPNARENSGRDYAPAPKPRFPHDDLSVTIRQQEHKRARMAFWALCGIAPFTIYFIVMGYLHKDWLMAGILFIVNLGLPIYIVERRRTYAEYLALPGSELGGNHHCVFCGHKGVYKKGQYKSDVVTATCTGCNAFLYVTIK